MKKLILKKIKKENLNLKKKKRLNTEKNIIIFKKFIIFIYLDFLFLFKY